MIGFLRGRLAARQAPTVLIECAGVGYEVETPLSTFLELPEVGSDVFLYTQLLVREDAHTLYGFSSGAEKTLFKTLLKVSGVGAKMGLAILSAMTVADFERCVQVEDTAMLVKIPGVGKKTAERLIIEMRDKIGTGHEMSTSSRTSRISGDSSPRAEAIDALVTLGYKPAEVNRMLAKIDMQDQSAEDIIRQALRKAVT
jgi:Holliday junction DNA helicase RuvA